MPILLSLAAAVFFATLLALALLYLYFSLVRHSLAIEHVRLHAAPWSTEQDRQLVVVHLSDFHYDSGLEHRNDAILSDILRAIDEVRPDLILLTGDYVNKHPAPVERLCRVFVAELKGRSRLGVFATLGNHDSYGGGEEVPTPYQNSADYIASCLESAGVTVLRNRIVALGNGVYVCGLEDLWNPGWRSHRRTMEELHRKEEGGLRIIMSHNPDTATKLREFRYDLQLSGHAHGGQICLPSIVKMPGWDSRYNVPVLGLLRPIIDWAIPRVPVAGIILGDMRRRRKYCHVINRWEWSQGLHGIPGESSAMQKKELYVTRGVGTHR